MMRCIVIYQTANQSTRNYIIKASKICVLLYFNVYRQRYVIKGDVYHISMTRIDKNIPLSKAIYCIFEVFLFLKYIKTYN